jgi:hypothetical protein
MTVEAQGRPDFLSRVLNHSATSWLVLAITALPTIWLTAHPGTPGVAIGVLAVVAAVLVFIQPNSVQKLLFIVAMSGLFYAEMQAVALDAKQRESQRVNDQVTLNGQFERTIDNDRIEMRAVIDHANGQFKRTIAKFNNLEQSDRTIQESAGESVKQLTGGNSFPWGEPFSQANFKDDVFGKPKPGQQYYFLARNTGDYAISGVDVEIVHMAPKGDALDELDKPDIYHVGTIAPKGVRIIPFFFRPSPEEGGAADTYILNFYYSGGEVMQYTSFGNGTGLLRFDELVHIIFAPAPCVVQQTKNFDQENYTVSYRIDSTGGDIANERTGRSIDSPGEQQYLSYIQRKCLAIGRGVKSPKL